MSQSLKDNDPSEPAMDQVESVERDVQKGDQRVVPPSQQDKGNQVHSGHGAGTVSDDTSNAIFLGLVRDGNNAKRYVHGDDTDEDKGVEAAGKRTHVDGPRQLELSVVSVSEQRGIDDMVLDLCEGPRRRHEVALLPIVEACQLPQIAREAEPCVPGEDDNHHQAKSHQGVTGEVIVKDLVERIAAMALFDLNRCGRESNQGQTEEKRTHGEQESENEKKLYESQERNSE